jgi:hypothetical protein
MAVIHAPPHIFNAHLRILKDSSDQTFKRGIDLRGSDLRFPNFIQSSVSKKMVVT